MPLLLCRFAPALAAALLAAGCTTAVLVEPAEPTILVEPASQELLLHAPGESRRLAEFLVRASGGRLDAVHVTVIAASPGLRHATARIVRATGVEPSKIRQVHGRADARGLFPIRVVAVRYHARPPHCPPLLAAGPSPDGNDFEPTLGCSDLANLALQVSDPRDLIGNPVVVPADGERAAVPVARYRLFGGSAGASPSAGSTSASSAGTSATTVTGP